MLSRATFLPIAVVLCFAFAPLYGGPPCPTAPGLTHVETSGEVSVTSVPTFAQGNLARAPDAVFFNTPHRSGHDAEFINDGQYSDARGMYFRGTATSGQVYTGIYWTGGGRTIREVAIGRDATFDHNDRAVGSYTFEYTTDVFTPFSCGTAPCDDSANVAPNVTWCPLGVASDHTSEPNSPGSTRGHRRRYTLPADLASVTGVRVVSVLENVIDELEIGGSLDALEVAPCLPQPTPGLTLVDTSGEVSVTSVPTFAAGNVARAPDAVFFNSNHRSGHVASFINDGRYGDSNGIFFRGVPTSGEIYAGVYWTGGPRTIREVAIGRDNANHNNTDRAVGTYTFEYTTDVFSPFSCGDQGTSCDDSANTWPTVQWCPLGLATAHNPNTPDKGARRRYTLPADLTGVTGVRFLTRVENVVDELEIGDSTGSLFVEPCLPQPTPGLTLLDKSGEVSRFSVPTFAQGNVARAPDAVFFNSPYRSGHVQDSIQDGNYSDELGFYFRGVPSSGEIYAGVYWTGGGRTIREVAIGRDNENHNHTDRAVGAYTLEYTRDTFEPVQCGNHLSACDDSANTWPEVQWCPLGIANAHSPGGEAATRGARRRYTLPADLTGVTGVRVLTLVENVIDELEIGDSAGSLEVVPCDPQPTPGLTHVDTSALRPADSVPTFADGNVARAPDAVFFNTSFRSGHDAEFINNGLYGDSNGIYFRINGGGPTSGQTYAGIYWTGGGRTIREVAIGRNNFQDENNRAVGAYKFEYTTDVFTPVPCPAEGTVCDDSANIFPDVYWCPLGIANAHSPSGEAATRGRRRQYTLPADLTGVTGVRVHTLIENVIDELEIGDSAGSLSVESFCADNIDNDLDGDTDCDDLDCCVDAACAAAPKCVPETACNDNLDNDLDGDTDCADSDCAAAVNCNPETACNDNMDNDLDGDTDCADSDCAAAVNCIPETACNDNMDNDLDGDTDCDDSDCASATNCLTVSVKPGDANGDGVLDGADPVAFLSWFFAGVDFPAPPGHELCLATPGDPDVMTAVGLQVLDWSNDGTLDLSDGVGQLAWTFSGAVPHPDCIPTVLSPPNCPNCIEVDNTSCIDTCVPD